MAGLDAGTLAFGAGMTPAIHAPVLPRRQAGVAGIQLFQHSEVHTSREARQRHTGAAKRGSKPSTHLQHPRQTGRAPWPRPLPSPRRGGPAASAWSWPWRPPAGAPARCCGHRPGRGRAWRCAGAPCGAARRPWLPPPLSSAARCGRGEVAEGCGAAFGGLVGPPWPHRSEPPWHAPFTAGHGSWQGF